MSKTRGFILEENLVQKGWSFQEVVMGSMEIWSRLTQRLVYNPKSHYVIGTYDLEDDSETVDFRS